MFDADAMLKNFAGYRGIAEATLKSLQSDMPERTQMLSAALAAGDLATAEREAHTVKGLAGNGGAPMLRAMALEMEDCCRAGQAAEARQKLAGLVAEVDQVLAEWRQFLASPNA